jgi:hypothetical protein
MMTRRDAMKKSKGFVFAVAAAVLGLAALISGAVFQQTAGELFEKALYIEEGQGDLQKAIGLYQDIVKRFPGEREAAAKALLHIGICYEKLGKSEARNAYSRLLQDYSDQTQPVKEARSRLAKLAAIEEGRIPEKGGPVFRKLDFPGSGSTPQVRLSPDGTKVLYIGIQDAEPRYSVRVYDFASGKSKTLVEGIDGNYWTHIFCWSPDGKKIVYLSRRGELSMINSEGGKPVQFWAAPDKETEIFPLDWSGENHSILVSILDQTSRAISVNSNIGPSSLPTGNSSSAGRRKTRITMSMFGQSIGAPKSISPIIPQTTHIPIGLLMETISSFSATGPERLISGPFPWPVPGRQATPSESMRTSAKPKPQRISRRAASWCLTPKRAHR